MATAGTGVRMGITFFFFLGAVSCIIGSGFFCLLAITAGDKRLVQMTIAATVVGCIAAVLLGRML